MSDDDYDSHEITTQRTLELFLEAIPIETLRILDLQSEDIITIKIAFSEGYHYDTMPTLCIKGAKGLEQFIKISVREFVMTQNRGLTVEQFFDRIWEYLQNRILTCQDYCPLCNSRHENPSVKLVPCSKAFCQWCFSEMGVGAGFEYEMKNFPSVVDLLISTTYLAAVSTRRNLVFSPFPERFLLPDGKGRDYNRVTRIISAFPPLQQMNSILATGTKALAKRLGEIDPDAYYLLRWILFSNRSHIKPIPFEKIKEKMPQLNYTRMKAAFEFISLPPEKEAEFNLRKANRGSLFAFHGSPNENWHSIIRNFLAVFSNTAMQLHGAAYGKGIYFAANQLTSEAYAKTNTEGLHSSSFGARPQMMLIAEIIKGTAKDHSYCFTVDDAKDVITRYLLVF